LMLPSIHDNTEKQKCQTTEFVIYDLECAATHRNYRTENGLADLKLPYHSASIREDLGRVLIHASNVVWDFG
jgi:hypothetical protein